MTKIKTDVETTKITTKNNQQSSVAVDILKTEQAYNQGTQEVEEVNLDTTELPKSANINRENIDFARIAKNADSALNQQFFDKSQIAQSYWGDNGQLNYKILDNGAVEIYENDTLMGYTDKNGLISIITQVDGSKNSTNDNTTETKTQNNTNEETKENTNETTANTTSSNSAPSGNESGTTTAATKTVTNNSTPSSGNSSLASFIADMTSSHEGSQSSINYNDNGAVSIGKIQWHADNAKNLLIAIRDANPSQFDNIISQCGAQNLANSLASGESWSNHIVDPGSTEANAITALLNTNESAQIQNQRKLEFVQSYINRAQSFGLTDPKAIAYISDMYNQYGQYSDLINLKIIPQALENGGDLDAVWNATHANTNLYLGRRDNVYNTLQNTSFDK